MSIKSKGIVSIRDQRPDSTELERALSYLKDGEYAFYICDKAQNKILPRLKYLFGVVLKTISEELPNHPSPDVLYRFFEKEYAPQKVVTMFDQEFMYQDLKKCTSTEMDKVIDQIIQYAIAQLGINIFSREVLKNSDVSEPYVGAYNDQWTDYSRTI